MKELVNYRGGIKSAFTWILADRTQRDTRTWTRPKLDFLPNKVPNQISWSFERSRVRNTIVCRVTAVKKISNFQFFDLVLRLRTISDLENKLIEKLTSKTSF